MATIKIKQIKSKIGYPVDRYDYETTYFKAS